MMMTRSSASAPIRTVETAAKTVRFLQSIHVLYIDCLASNASHSVSFNRRRLRPHRKSLLHRNLQLLPQHLLQLRLQLASLHLPVSRLLSFDWFPIILLRVTSGVNIAGVLRRRRRAFSGVSRNAMTSSFANRVWSSSRLPPSSQTAARTSKCQLCPTTLTTKTVCD